MLFPQLFLTAMTPKELESFFTEVYSGREVQFSQTKKKLLDLY